MSDIVIRAEKLSKRYRIGEREQYVALRDVLARAASAPFRLFRGKKPQPANGNGDATHIWALKDVSFEIHQGEIVGIIGRNGAGKSTLLKILARVTKPTRGYADVRGRMGSLLEVGTGFHPELTGRENTFLNGAILGMSKQEVARKFDEIVAFAEIEKFIDTPIKHYSTGMYLRLAFAVAAHLETEILVIDEVLAVGDVDFQKKCLGRVGDVARQGRTVLFVSHSMASVTSLCTRGVLLDSGRVKVAGPVRDIVDHYLAREGDSSEEIDVRDHRREYGSGEVKVSRVNLLDRAGNSCRQFEYGDDLCFEITLERLDASPPIYCVVEIRTTLGVPVLHLFSLDDSTCGAFAAKSGTKVRCVLGRCDLYPGTYSMSVWLGPNPFHNTDLVRDVLRFHMDQGRLRCRGFDMNWGHGLVHRTSSWHVDDAGLSASVPHASYSPEQKA